MFLLGMLNENSLVEIIDGNPGNVEDVGFSGNEQAEMACCLNVITPAVVLVAHLEDLPEIENY